MLGTSGGDEGGVAQNQVLHPGPRFWERKHLVRASSALSRVFVEVVTLSEQIRQQPWGEPGSGVTLVGNEQLQGVHRRAFLRSRTLRNLLRPGEGTIRMTSTGAYVAHPQTVPAIELLRYVQQLIGSVQGML